jgi:hypothetical protein
MSISIPIETGTEIPSPPNLIKLIEVLDNCRLVEHHLVVFERPEVENEALACLPPC